jgi:hypothetical protein
MTAMMERPEWRGSRPTDGAQPIVDNDAFPLLDAPLSPVEKDKRGRRKEIRKLPALY